MASTAEPLLASAIWKPPLSASNNAPSEAGSKPQHLSTSCQLLDQALSGGLSYGTLSCISGEPDTGSREIAQDFLVSQLLSSPEATATVVDTGMSLDVRRLHRAIVARLKDRVKGDAAEKAAGMLERVNVMKVFDFVGMTEAIGEVRDRLAGRDSQPMKSAAAEDGKTRAPRGTVGDSEDEASSDEEQGDIPSAPANPGLVFSSASDINATTTQPHLLIIDNIAQVTAPLLKANYTRGQALLSSFMRSLRHLTQTHSICTILLNGVSSYSNTKDESPSIFSSCALQPALGRAFAYAVDVHLLVHQVARAAGGREKVSVVEVLQDRYAGRSGRWAAFTVDDEHGGLVGISS